MYKVCMFMLSQRSKFFHGRRRKKLLSKLRTKRSVNTSIGSRFHPTVVAALKSGAAASKDKSLPGFFTAGSIASIYGHTLEIVFTRAAPAFDNLFMGCVFNINTVHKTVEKLTFQAFY